MKKNEVEKENKVSIDLTKKEVDNLTFRQEIINNKFSEIEKLKIEMQLLQNEQKIFYDKLLLQYKLDSKKKYKVNNGTLMED
jgi:hypothetical protein